MASKEIASGDISGADAAWESLAVPAAAAGAVYRFRAPVHRPMQRGHRHTEWEFNLVTRGHAVYLVDGQRTRIELDSVLWLLPSQGHLLLERSDDFVMWIVVVRPRVVRRLGRDAAFAAWRPWWPASAAPPPPLHRLVGEDAARSLSALCERLHGSEPETTPEHHAAGLTYLVAEAWTAYSDAVDRPAGSHLHPAVQTAVTWLAEHAHLPEAEDLDALAARCHVSRPHLSRLFRGQVGVTLTDFRNRQRVERFAMLVGRGRGMTLTEAAYAAGFGSYTQAYRVVKQVRGVNPRALLEAQPS
ncbi:MAG: AraC family transcriptional regulator [Planctomycetota bacterium]